MWTSIWCITRGNPLLTFYAPPLCISIANYIEHIDHNWNELMLLRCKSMQLFFLTWQFFKKLFSLNSFSDGAIFPLMKAEYHMKKNHQTPGNKPKSPQNEHINITIILDRCMCIAAAGIYSVLFYLFFRYCIIRFINAVFFCVRACVRASVLLLTDASLKIRIKTTITIKWHQ